MCRINYSAREYYKDMSESNTRADRSVNLTSMTKKTDYIKNSYHVSKSNKNSYNFLTVKIESIEW